MRMIVGFGVENEQQIMRKYIIIDYNIVLIADRISDKSHLDIDNISNHKNDLFSQSMEDKPQETGWLLYREFANPIL